MTIPLLTSQSTHRLPNGGMVNLKGLKIGVPLISIHVKQKLSAAAGLGLKTLLIGRVMGLLPSVVELVPEADSVKCFLRKG